MNTPRLDEWIEIETHRKDLEESEKKQFLKENFGEILDELASQEWFNDLAKRARAHNSLREARMKMDWKKSCRNLCF